MNLLINKIIFHVYHNVKKTGKHYLKGYFSCFLATQLLLCTLMFGDFLTVVTSLQGGL